MIQIFNVKCTYYAGEEARWIDATVKVFAHSEDGAKNCARDKLEREMPRVHRSRWSVMSVEKVEPRHKVMI